jgi:hypothetical protein
VRIAAFLVSLAIILKISLKYFSTYRGQVAESLAKWLFRLLIAEQRSRFSWISFPIPSKPVFIASIKRDEARIWLGLFHGTGEWPILLFAKLRPYLLYGWILLFIGGVPLAGLEKGICSGSRSCAEFIEAPVMASIDVLLVLSFLAIFLPMVSVPFSTVVRGHEFAFGWEGFLGNLVLQIRPSTRPKWAVPLGSRIVELSPDRTKGLRHSSIYEDDILIDELVAWLTGKHPCRSQS